jgi:hypothetical protein
MANEELTSADPLIDTPTPAPTMDYPAHILTYNRFLHLSKWFIIHFVILLPGLYFIVIGGAPMFGTVLLLGALVALGYGIFTTTKVRRNLEAAMVDRKP